MSGKISPRQLRHGKARDRFWHHAWISMIVGDSTKDDVPILEVRIKCADTNEAQHYMAELEQQVKDYIKQHGGRYT